MWFEKLTGFREEGAEQVRASLSVDGPELRSAVNGRRWQYGELQIVSLAELRERVAALGSGAAKSSLREVVADVQELHVDPSNAGALFQVASQFNLLEMASPSITPEHGVGIYENDRTQGPACAIAAGAGTIYRNYFVNVGGQVGQSAANQIDCLGDVGAALGNTDGRLWRMRNGYVLPTHDGLTEVSNRLRAASEDELDQLRALLRIGIQWDAEVTLNNAGQLVSQAYCSALPVAYSSYPATLWQPFARLVLEAAYEATFRCAVLNNLGRKASNKLFLTLLGGGAFGNESDWIAAAIRRAWRLYCRAGLDAAIVSYGASQPSVQRLVGDLIAG